LGRCGIQELSFVAEGASEGMQEQVFTRPNTEARKALVFAEYRSPKSERRKTKIETRGKMRTETLNPKP